MTTATIPNGPSAGNTAEPGAAGALAPAPVEQGWLGASSMFAPADHRQMGRAFSTSAALHAALVALVILVMWLRPPAAPPEVTLPEKYDLVFVQAIGPGGGGGGGGNSSPEPPVKIEMKADMPKPVVVEPLPEAPPPPPSLVAPVQMSAVVPTSGTLSGLAAAPSLGTGTGGGGGTGRGTGTGSGIGEGTGGGFGGGAMRPGSGVVNPTILRQLDPKYTPDAMRAKIQGVVELEAVVGVNGLITEIRVTKSLDRAFGLDDEAIRTARQWLFRPGTFQGKPVPVLVIIQMEFHLR